MLAILTSNDAFNLLIKGVTAKNALLDATMLESD